MTLNTNIGLSRKLKTVQNTLAYYTMVLIVMGEKNDCLGLEKMFLFELQKSFNVRQPLFSLTGASFLHALIYIYMCVCVCMGVCECVCECVFCVCDCMSV
jgi:hypothetical protein